MGFRPSDLARLRLPGAPTLAPDGTTAVVAVQTVDPDGQRYRSRLHRLGPDGTTTPVTGDEVWSDTAPVYSPDGAEVAFLSTRDGRRQAYALDPVSRRVRSLGRVDGEVIALAWLAADTVAGVVEHKRQPSGPVVIDWLKYKRDGETAFVEPEHELWTFGPGGAELLHRPAGRVNGLTAAPGGLLFAVEPRNADEAEPPAEVRWLDLAGGADRLVWRCPSRVNGLTATAASGRWLAAASAVAGNSATAPHLWCLAGDGTATEGAGLEVERASVGDARARSAPRLLGPVDGSDDVLVLHLDDLDVALSRVDPATGAATRLTAGGESVCDFSAARAGRVAVCVESPTAPAELRLLDLATGEVLATSAFNAEFTAATGPVAPERVEVGGMHALRYTPPGAPSPGPAVIKVHGGPHMAYGTTFDLESQLLAAAGYRVLLPNPRGSAGRGPEFRAGSVGQWGDGDYADLMAFTDDLVATGGADPDRLYLIGGSYGGYLINWTLTRTGRFRAAVSERSISNLLSKYGTSDNGATVNKFEFGDADLFDAEGAAFLLDRSPLRHADKITTPVLLLHGENDYRCPIEQSEQLFTALRRLGKEARFVRFPGESHALTTGGRPTHRQTRFTLILDWLATH
jgi:dipeptidyl aminopeptidase/acylaminoacyl peptidase